MPMSSAFKDRLFPALKSIVEHYGTPFHIYDEIGIRETGRSLKHAFSELPGFREFFAVKALPNPRILEIMQDMGFGFDCSSITELLLSRRIGAKPEDIMFTSNNTSREEFLCADAAGGCILNLDDITLLPKVPRLPELICFRYNPGPRRTGNDIIGNPVDAKYGVSHDQILDAYRQAREMGARRFGLHTMLASNELNYAYMVQTAEMLLSLIEWLHSEIDIVFEFINIGGGLGIPYRPEEPRLDLAAMAGGIRAALDRFTAGNNYAPQLYMESGRYMSGPHGVLVTTAINRKNIYRKYIGVDACMSALMRPGMYDAYHHIDVLDKDEAAGTEIVDVVGSLCENNDKFAVERPLPSIDEGDILVIHDTGAHGHAMGFNYNGKLRPQELLLKADGTVERIRRAETPADYFATLDFTPDIFKP
ncbi:diaminopimelate decarboxylase [Desulfococcus multivorans]|uniref:Putative Orn/DAP/Arg decarboxylase 2 n=1 Tax=Desulfococcus multivorans DSM 2059 TaxID=1121405 RepID=S7U2U1_DESML|nr:diaminopimelate decarboxylase [Desulfococcus multivorans]AOY58500.1 LysA2: diaminopimelate decarboxylase [Desulfococcus multivorans]AQV00814.1 diaminopimelate decarboxylase [Desulfococcus multivorans]EPR43285.1 putative Orn/DAP/Arg decarboxylase 2 [Desulfococcus multivorans DSM 2059]SJZ42058.1 diaminopimelate decarboxylase [Desulfococcus multivorans DSM 2059]